MSYSLKNKTVFVTGATAGFGQAIATQCIKAGARVVATGRREDRLKELNKRLGDKLLPLVFDVRDRAKVQSAIRSLPKDFAAIDILVNNAGLALGFEKAPETSLDNWEQMVDTNIKGVLYCTDALLPGMVKRGGGHLVNIGSVAGNYPYPCGNVYGATKAFIKQFSLNLRADLIDKNVRVTNIEPGMAETEFSLVRLKDATKAGEVYKGVEALSADDVADAVLYAVTRPRHVNINSMEIMPTEQAFSPFAVHRKS